MIKSVALILIVTLVFSCDGETHKEKYGETLFEMYKRERLDKLVADERLRQRCVIEPEYFMCGEVEND